MANPSPTQHRRATQITDEIATLGFALPGTVALRYTTCGTPGCRCHADPPQPHGPYPSWTRKVAGKTITRRLSAEQHARYQPWFQAHRRRRELLTELETLSLEIIETELRPPAGPKRPNSRQTLLASATGRGHQTIGADLDLPADTVRGWIRKATGRAE